MRAPTSLRITFLVVTFAVSLTGDRSQAALLAYEPFTNAPGAAIIGTAGGFGFSDVWQSNSSTGTATNTDSALSYTDGAGNRLVTTGGAGFFQGGLTGTSGNNMQPIRLFNFSRGTNGTDGVTTWISFLAVRLGPVVAGNNPYPRGANVPHDLNTGALQKLAIGNSSGAVTNTVGLIPLGAAGNLKRSEVVFSQTNFIVVRVDHKVGALDDAYLFLNPMLGVEPPLSQAATNTLGTYDFSFDRLRVFAGGNVSASQPYAEILLDEYRVGETYADVTPFATNAPPPPPAGLVITNTLLTPGGIVLSGVGGSSGGIYRVLASADVVSPLTNWPAIATNTFDVNGNFHATNPTAPAAPQQFFRLRLGGNLPVSGTAPSITTPPASQSVSLNNNATFSVVATGTAPLVYQWYFNTNTPLAGATNSSVIITNAQTTNAGGYSVVITNGYGAVTSQVATLTVNGPLLAGAYFVSVTNGNDANPGTEASPFKTISRGLSFVSTGGVVYVRSGTYALNSKLSLSGSAASATNPIRLWAYPGEFPVIDSTGNSGDGIGISGRFHHLKGLTVMNAGHNGINISGHSNIVEFCTVHDNGNTGLHITGGNGGTIYPSYNLILNCDAYLNYDPPIGGNADGFSAKWSLGPGNVFRGCRAWWNSDDGWDLWMGTAPILIDNCWAFWNGTNYWNDPQFNGNGQGFKLGGNYVGTPHRLARSLAFENESNGVDQNNNEEGQTVDNNTCWGNQARNFNLNHGTNSTPHLVRNNLSFAGASGDSFRTGTIFTNNSWQVVVSPAANAGDVLSVNTSGMAGPRPADGSLPVLNFMRPVPGGRLVDQGVDVGWPFNGSAPDLGAFETGP